MKLKSLLVMLSVLAVAGLANAQGVNAYIFWADDGQGVPEPPLTDLCAGGTPLPEQTTIIEIYWDNDSNGPDADDPQPVICNNPPECLDGPTGTVNLNSFPMTNAGPGYYFPDNTFNTTGIVPQPSRYYLRCCIGPRHWVSSVFILNAGFSDVGPSTYLPTPAVTYTWSCVEEPCAGCQLPPAVASFDASDNLCNGVQLTWAYADTNNAVDSLLISRDGALIAMVSDNAPDSYLDTGAPFNVNIAYQIEARRICTAPADTAYSPIQPATGFRTPAPPVPTNVTASDATCDNVTVSWSYTTNQGLGYWVIARNGDSVGTVAGGGTPGNRNFTHLNAPGGVAEYCVHGASASCGWGTPDCDNGNANIDPGQVQGVNATDGQCNTTVVTWTDLNTVEDNYFVTRDGTNISGSLGGDVTLYNDNSGAAGQVYAYRVVATNECGQGPASDSNNGSRITVPSQVTGVLATDNTLCDMVTVTWTNLTNETGYQIRRDNVAIDCVAVDVASYNDLSAVPGTIYQYIVVAKNTCGYGAFSNQNAGQRKAPPPQVTGVSATDTSCANVRISWLNVTGEDSFQVRRNGTRIGRTLTDVLFFVDTTAVPGTTYSYTIIAYNSCGGTESPADNGIRLPGLGQVAGVSASDNTSCTTVFVTWTDNIAGEDSFQVRRDGVRIGRTLAGGTSFDDLTATAGVTYTYRIVAYNACGAGDTTGTDQGSRLMPLGAVTNVSATDDDCDNVTITWTDPAGDDSVQIRRDGARIGSVTGATTQFTDNTAATGITYLYRVVAYNTCGAGDTTGNDTGVRPGVPGVPTNVVATEDRCDSVVVTWDAVATATLYRVFRDNLDVGTTTDTRFAHQPGFGVEDYMVAAENACGAGNGSAPDNGERLVFPVAPTTVTASDTSCNGVNVTWSGATGDVDSFRVYRGATLVTTVGPAIDSFFDVSADVGVNDYTVVSVSTECGDSDPSAIAQGTRITPAGIPQDVAATDNLCDSVYVTWTAASGDVDGYKIYEGVTEVGDVAGSELSFGYDPAQGTYSYTVKAYSNECGLGDASSADNGTRAVPPTAASNLQTSTIFCDRIQMSWNAGTGGIDGYIINRDGTDIDTVDAGETSYADLTASDGSHDYYVVAYSVSCDNAEASNTDSGFRITFPSAPANLAASDTSCAQVYLVWDAIAEPLDYYVIYENGDSAGTSVTTDFNYAPASPGLVYSYTVAARNLDCGTSVPSLADNGVRLEGALPPTNLAATDNDCDAIILSWNTAVGFIEEYRVYRDGNPVAIATVIPPDTTYSDVIEAGVTHTYEVSAFNTGCGETNLSNSDEGMRRPVLGQVVDALASNDNCDGILVSWTGLAGAEKYYIYKADALYDSVNHPTVSYLDTDVLPGESATYSVAAVNVCGAGLESGEATGQRMPLANTVQNVTAVSNACGSIDVAWDDVTGELGYIVMRDDAPVASLGPDVTTHTDIVNGEHTYMVLSRNACDTSDASNEATDTAPEGVLPVSNVLASTVYCDSIVIGWTESANALFYSVWRGGNLVQSDIPAGTDSFTDVPPAPGDYEYDVAAHNECGQGSAIGDAMGHARTSPPEVTGTVASQSYCDSIVITWNNNDIPDLFWVDFVIWIDGVAVDTVEGTENTYTYVTGPGSYPVIVQAISDCGDGPIHTPMLGIVPDAPANVPDFAATFNQCATVTLTWTDLPDETSYEISRNGDSLTTVAADVTTYADSPPDFATYTYGIVALNTCGESPAEMSAQGARRDTPTQITGLTATNNSCTEICLNWNDPTNEDAINVFRDDAFLVTLEANTTTYCDQTATPGSHDYYVVAGNICGPAPASEEVTGFRIPSMPQVQNAQATDNSFTDVVITWDDVTGETGFHVYRDGNLIFTTGADVTTYTDAPAVGTYNYCVSAFNDCGDGTQGCDSGTRRGPPAPVTGVSATDDHCNDVVVTWNDVADETGYTISRSGTEFNVGPNTTSFTDTPPPGTYSYTVMAYNEGGPGLPPGGPDSGTRLTVPGQVVGVSATDNRCDAVVVTWSDLAGETAYRIFRGPTDLGTVGAGVTTYTDATAPEGATNSYTVQAENTCGPGLVSAGENGTRLDAPSAPTNVDATDNLCGQITITWEASTGCVDEYRVYLGAELIGTDNTPPFSITDDIVAGTYDYTVHAYCNGTNCPDGIAPVSGTSHAAPSAPGTLTVGAPPVCGHVDLDWLPATGEVEEYHVYRDGVQIGTTAGLTFTDNTVNDRFNHNYAVRAFNTECGEGNPSNTAVGRARELLLEPEVPTSVLSGDTIDVDLDHCAGVEIDSVFLSINGGAYQFVARFAPVVPSVEVPVPAGLPDTPNNRIRIISVDGTRRDTVFTATFNIQFNAVGDEIGELPTDYVLEQNYPNPFNPSTTIRFGLPVEATVTVEVFDVMGRQAAILIDNQSLQPGWHNAVWNCSQCPSGMYLVRVQAADRTMLRKMLLMK